VRRVLVSPAFSCDQPSELDDIFGQADGAADAAIESSVASDEKNVVAALLVFFKQGRQMGSFCKYSFFA